MHSPSRRLTNDLALPTLNAMLELYGSGMSLVLESKAFLRQIEMLKRLSLNAEIQAVHSGDAGVVFQTIAKELGVVSQDARTVLGDLMRAAQKLSRDAVNSAALARLCEKYQAAKSRGLEARTEERVCARLSVVGEEMLQQISSIRTALGAASEALEDIDRLGIQLPMISTLLRIEAHRQAEVHQALASNALELGELKSTLNTLLGKVKRQTAYTMSTLNRMS